MSAAAIDRVLRMRLLHETVRYLRQVWGDPIVPVGTGIGRRRFGFTVTGRTAFRDRAAVRNLAAAPQRCPVEWLTPTHTVAGRSRARRRPSTGARRPSGL